MRAIFLFFALVLSLNTYSQLTKKGDDLVIKAIKKNDLEEKILKNENFEIEVKLSVKYNYKKEKDLWGFENLDFLNIYVGYRNNKFCIVEDSTNTVHNYKFEKFYNYSDNILLLIRWGYDGDTYLVLFNKNHFIYNRVLRDIDEVNEKLNIFNNNTNLENSFLLKDIYESLNSCSSCININNTDTLKFEEELLRLNFKFIVNDLNSKQYKLYTKEEYDVEYKEWKIKKKEKEEIEYAKNHITGYVKEYIKENDNIFNVYTGYLVDGKYEGNGKFRTSINEKNLTYEGEFKNDLYDGFGKMKISKWTYSGSYSQEDYNEYYEGEFKKGLFDGKGKYSIYDRATSRKTHHNYDGEFKNGLFHGKGKIIYNPTSHDDAWSYDGEWKNGKFDGFGVIKRYDKNSIESFQLASDKEFRGNFSNGKKNGEFIVNGIYQGKADYKFSYKITYNNDVEVNKIIIYDQINERNNEIADANYAYQSKINAENKANCEKCNIDWKNSKSPKDDYALWVKVGRKAGIITMENGDYYNFDYENGKCKVTNGWFKSDDYYSTFDIMIENLLKKCKENYCR